MADVKKPIPVIDGDSKPFWDGCKEGKLLIQYCRDCGTYIFYPRSLCTECMSNRIKWIQSSGEGTIYTYTIARKPAGKAFADDVPYVIAIVELKENVRMMTNIINVDVDEVHCEMPVEVIFVEVEDWVFPKFQPVKNKNS